MNGENASTAAVSGAEAVAPAARPVPAGAISPRAAEWSVAVFSSRERADVLDATVRAALRASAGRSAVVDVLVNGNARLAREVRTRLDEHGERSNANVRIWFITLADKAHTFNEYIHRLWPGSAVAYFIDGYARPRAQSLDAIARALDADPFPLGATGIPTVGRSARSLRAAMLDHGGIHGNLYALRGGVIDEIRASGCRLPLGIYKTDPMVGAWLAFGLDPALNDWDLRRVKVVPEASWDFDPLSIWRASDLATHAQRWMRQQQGWIENNAIHDFLAIRRLHPRALPKTIAELVSAWLEVNRADVRRHFLRYPLSRFMLARFRPGRDWSLAAIPPRLVEKES